MRWGITTGGFISRRLRCERKCPDDLFVVGFVVNSLIRLRELYYPQNLLFGDKIPNKI